VVGVTALELKMGVHSEEECYIAPELEEDGNHTENAFDGLHEEEAKIKL
jgi:hypothetical protein